MKESDLERYLVKKMEEIGASVYKTQSPTRGFPDRLVIYAGHMFLIETKILGGKLSKAQEYRHREISRQKVKVYTIWNKKEVNVLCSMITKHRSLSS